MGDSETSIPKKPVSPPPSAKAEAGQTTSVLSTLLSGTRRNEPLPLEPVIVNIAGRHGQSIALDPRRIRTLEGSEFGNPRLPSSPGLTEESLRKLGDEIVVAGQMEDVMVCPIIGDPDFDAQLIDGERRKKSTHLVRIMVWVSVREDVTPEDGRKMYLMSVIRNRQKVAHTTQEDILMVKNFRGPFGMTIVETAETMGISPAVVSSLQRLGSLHPDVQAMISDGVTGGRHAERKLTPQHAGLLYDIAPSEQCGAAQEIVSRRMNIHQAERYIKNLRRKLGLGETPSGRKRHTEHSQALATLVRNSYDKFGMYWDKPTDELEAMLSSYMAGARLGVYKDLLSLTKMINELTERVKPVEG